MQTLTLEQLRATCHAGGVTSVTLKAEGSAFYVSIETRNGNDGVLVKTRSKEPRPFADPRKALVILRDMGISITKLDATHWNSQQEGISARRPDRAKAMKKAHEAAAYNAWLEKEVQAAIDDPRPNIPHDEVMQRLDEQIRTIKARKADNVSA
jgi:hypothetical protein